MAELTPGECREYNKGLLAGVLVMMFAACLGFGVWGVAVQDRKANQAVQTERATDKGHEHEIAIKELREKQAVFELLRAALAEASASASNEIKKLEAK